MSQDRKAIEAYAGVEITLPDGKVVRTRAPTLAETAGYIEALNAIAAASGGADGTDVAPELVRAATAAMGRISKMLREFPEKYGIPELAELPDEEAAGVIRDFFSARARAMLLAMAGVRKKAASSESSLT